MTSKAKKVQEKLQKQLVESSLSREIGRAHV